MCETFKACFEKLEVLSNKELDLSVVELVAVENRDKLWSSLTSPRSLGAKRSSSTATGASSTTACGGWG